MQISFSVIFIMITIGVSIVAFSNRQVFDLLRFNAYLIHHNKQVWRFLSGALIHVDFIHLAVNMYVLYMFGPPVEMYLTQWFDYSLNGPLFYLLLYIGGAILSCLYSFEKHKKNLWYNAVGASGAVSSVVFAFIAIRPDHSLFLLFLPGIPIPAFLLGILYLLYSWFMARNKRDNVGHDAHFFGAIFGFLFMFIIQPSLFTRFIHTVVSFITGS